MKNKTNRRKGAHLKRGTVESVIDAIFCVAAIVGIIAGVIALGSWLAVRATAAEMEMPAVKFFTDEETDMIAKTVWGEARGCSDIQQEAVAWCILNRVDDPRFPDSIAGVITQKNEFFGYDFGNPVEEDIYAAVLRVLLVWATEEIIPADGRERVLPREYVFFSGDGVENTFTTAYLSGKIWDWSGIQEAEAEAENGCSGGVVIGGC